MSENKSRIERYAKLRQDLIDQQQNTIETKELSIFANQLNQLDEDHFKRMDIEIDSGVLSPLQFRSQRSSQAVTDNPSKEVPNFEPTSFEPVTLEPHNFPEDPSIHDILESYESEEISDEFVSSYVDDVLNEVKSYNLEKGYRKKQDTRSNVLSGVLPSEEYGMVSEIEHRLRRDQRQLRKYPEEPIEDIVYDTVDLDETIKLQVEQLSKLDITQPPTVLDEQPTAVFEFKEATQQMQTLIDQQNAAVESLDKKLNSSNTFINVLLGVVILLFIMVIVAIIYVFLQLR